MRAIAARSSAVILDRYGSPALGETVPMIGPTLTVGEWLFSAVEPQRSRGAGRDYGSRRDPVKQPPLPGWESQRNPLISHEPFRAGWER
jgi:hypothetical protein